MAQSSATPASTNAKADGAAAPPACDQCRSRKIRCSRERPECRNCRKAGVSCGFSNRGRKVNHTLKLIDDFSGLAARLDSIDQSIARIARRLPSVEQDSASGSHTSDVEVNDLFYKGQEWNVREQENAASCLGGMLLTVHQKPDDRGGERYYGPTAALSLIESSRRVLGEILCNSEVERRGPVSSLVAKDASLRSELRDHYNAFPFLDSCREPGSCADGKAVATPPRSFLNSVIDCFLNEINTARPIFEQSRLREAIEQHYSDDSSETNEARSLCFNNIILLTLALKSRLSRRNCSDGNGMDDDLLLSFLKNSRRAFGRLDRYHEPYLVNVQALVTLAMVAREYCDSEIFERLSQMACHVAKSTGLLQMPKRPKSAMSAADTERTNLFWALYVMDKERVFMTGLPCDLYLFDTDMQILESDSDSTLQHYTVAHYHMMSLWERMHILLYSSRVARKGLSYRLSQVSKLSSLFRDWRDQYEALLNAPLAVAPSATDYFRMELKYCFHVGQILIHLCGCEESNKQQRLNSVHAALNIIKDVREACTNLGMVALLGRLFRCYPITPFLDLYTSILETPDSQARASVDLLVTTADAVSLLEDPNLPHAYYTRLHSGMRWCIKVARTVINAAGQPPAVASVEQLAVLPKTISGSPVRPVKPLPVSAVGSTPSHSRRTRYPSHDDSPRPRKRPSPQQFHTRSTSGHARIIPRAQEFPGDTTLSDGGKHSDGARHSASLSEDDDPMDTVPSTSLALHSANLPEWSFPASDPNAFLNIPVTFDPSEVFYEVGTFDDYTPRGTSAIIEPWEMEFTDQMMLDGFEAKKFVDQMNARR